MGAALLLVPVLATAACAALLAAALAAAAASRQRRNRRIARALAGATPAGPTAPRPPARRLARKPPRKRRSFAEYLLDGTGAETRVWHLAASFVLGATAAPLVVARLFGAAPPLLAVAALGGGCATAMLFRGHRRARHEERFYAQFPQAVDVIARAIRSGLPITDAMGLVASELPAPVGTEFRRVLEELRIGALPQEAFGRAAERLGFPEFRFFVLALDLQRETGGSLAETLETLGSVIRRRKELRLKTRALTAESRASTALLAGLPFATAAALHLVSPAYLARLVDDPRGAPILLAAGASLVTGVALGRLLIRRALG
jgi:tight adherence protein B